MDQKAQDPDELLDVVDSNDNVIGSDTRANIHAQKLFHRAVHILVFLPNGEVLLQQRSLAKDTCPGLFSTSCAGHVDSGEKYDDAAVRELDEELGITVSKDALEELFSQTPSRENGYEFVRVYALRNFEGEPAPNPVEILSLRRISRDRLEEEIETTPKQFAPSFISVWHELLIHELEVKLPSNEKRILVRLERTRRTRRMILRVDSSGNVTVSVPYFLKKKDIPMEVKLFVLKNLDWLDKRFEKLAKQPKEEPPKTLLEYLQEHPEIPVGNTTKRIDISPDSAPLKSFFVLQDDSNVIPVYLVEKNRNAELIEICREIARRVLTQRVQELATEHDISVGKISIRAQKSRWGSCTYQGDISLNFLAIFLPVEIRDHVILHELAHRRYMNHSDRFWGLLNSWDPQTEEHDRELTHGLGKALMRLRTSTK